MAVGPNKKPARKRIKAGSTAAKFVAGRAKAAKRGTDRMTVTDIEKAGKLVGMKKGGKMAKGYAKGGAKMMRAMGGKMAKGYAKGGAKMMKAMGGKMAKGYAKGGAKMSVAGLRAAAKKMGYKVTKA